MKTPARILEQPVPDQQHPTSTISSILLGHVLYSYRAVLHQTIQNEEGQTRPACNAITREGINIITDDAPPAYILAVASVEAFVNEVFLGSMAERFTKDTPLVHARDSLERLDLTSKLMIVPQLAFNQSFQKDQQPYQDMAILVKVRNDFVHFKMEPGEPTYLKTLQDRGIALSWPNIAWASVLSTSEGIRWAHNTACLTIQKLYDFLPLGYRSMLRRYIHDFAPISEQEVRSQFAQHRIDTGEGHGP